MSDRTKSILNAWLPALIALAGFVGNAMWFAKWTGEMESRLIAVETIAREHTVELKSDRYVPRAEYAAGVIARNIEMGEIKLSMREANAKLDALLVRTSFASQKND